MPRFIWDRRWWQPTTPTPPAMSWTTPSAAPRSSACVVDQARAQYWLGSAIAKGGKPAEAVPHYREAVKILETIAKQEGAGRVLERSDLKDLYHSAMNSYQGG